MKNSNYLCFPDSGRKGFEFPDMGFSFDRNALIVHSNGSNGPVLNFHHITPSLFMNAMVAMHSSEFEYEFKGPHLGVFEDVSGLAARDGVNRRAINKLHLAANLQPHQFSLSLSGNIGSQIMMDQAWFRPSDYPAKSEAFEVEINFDWNMISDGFENKDDASYILELVKLYNPEKNGSKA